MRKNIAILSILTTSLMSYAAMAQDEAAPSPEGAPPPEAVPPGPEAAPPAAAPPEPAPAPAVAPAAAPAGYPDEYALRPLTLAAGMFQGTLPIVLNLSKDAVLKPVSIPLDLRFGVTNELEVFVSHTVLGAPMAWGGGLCLGGTNRGCAKAYNNVNLGGQFSFVKASGVELSGLLAAEFRQFSPDMLFAVDVGVGVKYVAAPVSVKLAPQIGIGVNNRAAQSLSNKEDIAVPLQIVVQATPVIAPFLDTGILGSTQDFGKNYIVPLGIGASYLAMHGLDVGLEFLFGTLVRGDNIKAVMGNATDVRMLMLFASWRSM